jgi:hypothetical protein
MMTPFRRTARVGPLSTTRTVTDRRLPKVGDADERPEWIRRVRRDERAVVKWHATRRASAVQAPGVVRGETFTDRARCVRRIVSGAR